MAHNPQIDWAAGTLTAWSVACHSPLSYLGDNGAVTSPVTPADHKATGKAEDQDNMTDLHTSGIHVSRSNTKRHTFSGSILHTQDSHKTWETMRRSGTVGDGLASGEFQDTVGTENKGIIFKSIMKCHRKLIIRDTVSTN